MLFHGEEGENMALKLIKSNGAKAVEGYIPNWYGVYRDGEKVKTVSLGVPLRGRPPASGYLGDKGDREFERSRNAAQAELERRIKEVKERRANLRAAAAERGDAIRETRRIIELKTGRKFKDPPLADLADIYLGKLGDRSPCHVAMIRSGFSNFATFAANPTTDADGEDAPKTKKKSKTKKKPELKKATTLLEVTPELATAFFRHIAPTFAFSTVKRWSNLLSGAFERLAPVGMQNPFKGARLAAVGRAATKRNGDGEKERIETVIHHRPIDRAQLRRLYAAAKDDPLLYALTVTAAATGLRIGDCCTLLWKDIDLAGKSPVIFLTTAKTGAKVGVPIFDYRPDSPDYEPDLGEFRRVLETALAESRDDEKYVFPAAARLYLQTKTTDDGREHYPGRDVIYSRGKALFARALFADEPEVVTPDDGTKAEKTVEDILADIAAANWTDERKKRVSTIYTMHTGGASYNAIQAATGYAKSTISTDLAAVEELAGVKAKTRSTKPSVRDLLKHTRQDRAAGKRAASLYSWHSLRGSFVVMMSDNGVPLDTIRLLVGHENVDMTLEYFNPTQKIAAESARRIITRRNRRQALIDATGTRTGGETAYLPPPTANAPQGNLDALRKALAALTPKERAKLLKGIK